MTIKKTWFVMLLLALITMVSCGGSDDENVEPVANGFNGGNGFSNQVIGVPLFNAANGFTLQLNNSGNGNVGNYVLSFNGGGAIASGTWTQNGGNTIAFNNGLGVGQITVGGNGFNNGWNNNGWNNNGWNSGWQWNTGWNNGWNNNGFNNGWNNNGFNNGWNNGWNNCGIGGCFPTNSGINNGFNNGLNNGACISLSSPTIINGLNPSGLYCR